MQDLHCQTLFSVFLMVQAAPTGWRERLGISKHAGRGDAAESVIYGKINGR